MRTTRTTRLFAMALVVGGVAGCSLEQLQTESAALRTEAQAIIADVEASGILKPPASARLEWIDTRMVEIDDKIQGAETGFDLVDAIGGLAAGALGLGGPWMLLSRIARRKLAKVSYERDRVKNGREQAEAREKYARGAIRDIVKSIEVAKVPSDKTAAATQSSDGTVTIGERSDFILLNRAKLIDAQDIRGVTDIVSAARKKDAWDLEEAMHDASETPPMTTTI